VASIVKLARGKKLCTRSLTHPAYLMPGETKLLLRNIWILLVIIRSHIVVLVKSQLLFSSHSQTIDFNQSLRQTDSFTLSTLHAVCSQYSQLKTKAASKSK